jgi:hypothetical protein
MFSQLTLTSLQTLTPYEAAATTAVPSTPQNGTFNAGDVAVINDPTYGVIKAVFCRLSKTQATALPMAPAYLVPIYASNDNASLWTVADEYNDTDALGLAFTVGFIMATAAANPVGSLRSSQTVAGTWLAGDFCWVQVCGVNPYALVTDGLAAAGYELIGSTTAGICGGVVATGYSTTPQYTGAYGLGVAMAADNSSGSPAALAAGSAYVRSIWASLPRTV